MKLFIFGFGYSARAIARHMQPACDWIAGTSRDADKLAAMEADGVRAFRFDGKQKSPALEATLKKATHILVSIAPDKEGDPVLRCYRDMIEASVALDWIGYLSTVGVYGDHGGAWVNEDSPCKPVSTRSVQRVAAEAAWQDLASGTGKPVGIYRLAGIYGPGRNQMIRLAAESCRRIVKQGQVFNRIHVEDIALALTTAMGRRHQGILNVCDDEPAPPQDVIAHCARLLGIEAPPEQDFETAEMTSMARSFYGENKRCSNDRLHALLDGPLRYPTYREAFAAMVEKGNWRSAP